MKYNDRSDIRFVRIGGRVIPIKKRKVQGVTAVGVGSLIAAGSAARSAEMVNTATQLYGRSANLRGASKLAGKGSATYRELIRNAAVTRIAGKKLSRKGFGALALGLGVGSALVTLGIKKLSDKKDSDESVMAKAAAVTGAVTVGSLAIFGHKTRLGSLVKMSRIAKGKKPVEELFKIWSKSGMKKTANTIQKYAKTQYKGVKPKPKDIFKGKQQDLFGGNKPFGMKKLLGKD
jgi:hypothetical protein